MAATAQGHAINAGCESETSGVDRFVRKSDKQSSKLNAGLSVARPHGRVVDGTGAGPTPNRQAGCRMEK
jgi:hypothetical protein